MPARATAHVREHDKVRLYDNVHEWFDAGRVVTIDPDERTADVDYGDWVQRYFLDHLRVCYPEDGTYERCLIPTEDGRIVVDYRSEE